MLRVSEPARPRARLLSTFLIFVGATAVMAAASTALADPPAPIATPCGRYCGEGAPPAEPALFAPGWVNRGPRTRDIALSPDGRELYFGVMVGGFRLATVAVTRQDADGCWQEPELLPFATDPDVHVLEPHVAPDGQRLYFASDRPAAGEREPGDEDLFLAERLAPYGGSLLPLGSLWSAPRRLSAPVNTPAPEFFPSVTRSGALYFTRRDTTDGREVIMRSRPRPDGGWAEPEVLPRAVNAAPTQFNALVDPDERFVVVCLAGHPDNLGQVDYWVAFRDPDDTWHGPVNLGPRFNGPGREGWSPGLSPDGRAFFFMTSRPAPGLAPESAGADPPADRPPLLFEDVLAQHRAPGNGLGHMWWVDAGFLDDLAARARAGGGAAAED